MTRRLIILLFIAAAITLLPWWLRGLAAALVLLRLSAYNATIARGLWLRCGQPRASYITRLALPGLVLSDTDTDIDDDDTSIEQAVLPHQEAENTSSTISNRSQLIATLANLGDGDSYYFSANKIAELLKGTPWSASRNVVLDEINQARSIEPQKGAQGRWVFDERGKMIKVR